MCSLRKREFETGEKEIAEKPPTKRTMKSQMSES
jgi:hypothetical protein